MAMNHAAYLTRAQAAKVTGTSEATIGNWRARGWVTPSGERRHLTTRRGAGGNLEYRLGDLLDAERDTGANPKSRRSVARWRPSLHVVPSASQHPASDGGERESDAEGDRARVTPLRLAPEAHQQLMERHRHLMTAFHAAS